MKNRRLIFLCLITINVVLSYGQIRVPEGSTSPIYYKDGKVGIGEQNPLESLHVIGNGLFSNGIHLNSAGFYDYSSIYLIPKQDYPNKVGIPLYGIVFAKKQLLGQIGNVTHDWNMYFTHNSYGNRGGWIFNSYGQGNVAGIDTHGHAQFKGFVSIGKVTPATVALDVNGSIVATGTIKATEIKVEAQTADFVFEDDYNLRSLDEIETFIKANKHLPDIPSAKEMEEIGVNLAEMNKLLLQKVEELTLYLIELQKEVDDLKKIKIKLQILK